NDERDEQATECVSAAVGSCCEGDGDVLAAVEIGSDPSLALGRERGDAPRLQEGWWPGRRPLRQRGQPRNEIRNGVAGRKPQEGQLVQPGPVVAYPDRRSRATHGQRQLDRCVPERGGPRRTRDR